MKKAILTLSLTATIGRTALAADAATVLDEVVVTAAPLERAVFELAQPAAVLQGDRLTLALQPTLGETLARVPGVSSTYFGPAASRPVIRGLDADRIRILQNGSNTLDASATSVDHAVSFDPVSVCSIEIVRGPATLLYGPNAIGGVVNVLDRRIPDERITVPVRGSIEGKYGSVNSERGGSFTLEGGIGGFAWHLEGYQRATDELHIPDFARSEELRRRAPLEAGAKEARDVLPNSDLRTEGLSGGAAYVWGQGYFGIAYSGFHSNYGTVAERQVTIDMEQRRFDFRGAFFAPFAHVRTIQYRVGISDYEHTEFEGALVGTKFENEGYDGRLELTHEKLGPFEGALGFQSEKSNFSALGEEAFLPPVETRVNSVFVFEEAAFDPFRIQLGLRYDHIAVESSSTAGFGRGQSRTFDHLSASAGLIYTPAEGYAIALNAAFTQRAPTYQELFARGPHVATNTFEVGDSRLGTEKAISLDLALRRKTGRVTGAVGVFYHRFTDFIGQFANGDVVAGEEDDLPVSVYRATDADFFGGEAEVTWHLLAPATESPATDPDGKSLAAPALARPVLDLEFKADYVHATDRHTHDPLPRIPPFRASAALLWQRDRFSARVEGQYNARQNRTADDELPTESYFLLNASLSYRATIAGTDADFFLKGVNLTDAEARQHTSFLKDIAPLGGRGVVCGVKLTF